MENEKIQVEYRSNMSSTLKQHKQDMDIAMFMTKTAAATKLRKVKMEYFASLTTCELRENAAESRAQYIAFVNKSLEMNALREYHFHVLEREYSSKHKLEAHMKADISKLEAQTVALSTALYIACIVCFVFAGLCCYQYTKCQPAPETARPEYSVNQAYVRQLEERLAVLQPQLRASTSSLASGRTDATLSFEYSTEDDSAASVIEI